jgi:hypothetical protein
MDATGGCSAMYSACGGGGDNGGSGYGGTPFDSGSYFMGGYMDLPGHTGEGMRAYDQRVQNTRDALAATAAYQRGGPNDPTYKALMARNSTLLAVVVLSPEVRKGLQIFASRYGQAAADKVLFDIVASITGLSDYINATPDYNPDTRTFTVNFDPGVDKFLANSPYFAGPGIALLHLDVGTFDYRSYTDLTGGLSLQVVPGRDLSRSYADFDKYNPYQDGKSDRT